jgi:hypothetical protein
VYLWEDFEQTQLAAQDSETIQPCELGKWVLLNTRVETEDLFHEVLLQNLQGKY